MKSPESIYEIKQMHLDNVIGKLNYASKNIISQNRNRLIKIESKSILKNPDEVTRAKREIFLRNTDKLKILVGGAVTGTTLCELSLSEIALFRNLRVTAGIDMSNGDLQNVNLTGTVKSGGDSTYTGTVNFIKSIQDNGGGRITWYNGTATIKNGLITNIT